MKQVYLILSFILPFFLVSCEDVVHLDMDTASPRLVVEASINWYKGSKGDYQIINLTTTTDFYNNTIPQVGGADVFITNSKGDNFNFEESGRVGQYICDHFVPVIGETYTLTVIYKDEIYTATETMLAVPDLLYADQETAQIIGKIFAIKAYFKDPADETNFYMHRFIKENKRPQSAVFDDRYVNGNYTFTLRVYDELVSGERLNIELYGISSQYYDYMGKILLTISEGNTGPFEVAPAQIRGNIINKKNINNFAFGYFRLSEVSVIDYTAQ